MAENIFKILLNRPAGSIGIMDEDEQQFVQTAVDAYLRGETVSFLEFIHSRQWEYFYQRTKNKSGRIQVWSPLPADWPVGADMQIKVWHSHNYKFASEFNRLKKSFPVQHHRQSKSFDHEFVMLYGSWQHERETVMQTLERLHILDRSIYSRPPQIAEYKKHINCDYLFPITSEAEPRTIEQTHSTISHEQRFCHESNIFNLFDASKTAHCWVVMDCYCLNNDMTGTVTEKVLYPILYGVPFIYIGNHEQRLTLSRWGIRPNDLARADVRSVAEQMLWLQSIFRDPELAQQWQDRQGETIISNLRALENLPAVLKKGL